MTKWKNTLPECWLPSPTAAVKALTSAIQYSQYNVNRSRSCAGCAAADIRAYRKSLGVKSERVEVSVDGMSDERVLWWAIEWVSTAATFESPELAARHLRHAEAWLRELWKRSDG